MKYGKFFQRKQPDYVMMNELQKYKEIQKRTKLLYGVKDKKKIIQTKEAINAYNKDICSKSSEIIETMEQKETEIKKDGKKEMVCKFSFKDLIKPQNYIISLDSTWKTPFDAIINVVVFYSCITTTFVIAFDY